MGVVTNATGISFHPRKYHWDSITGLLDSIRVGSQLVSFGYNAELFNDQTSFTARH